MKIGGQIPWNVTPICETSQIYYLMERRPMTSSNSADQLWSLGPNSDYDKDQKTEAAMFSFFMLTHDTLRSTGECAQISQSRNLQSVLTTPGLHSTSY